MNDEITKSILIVEDEPIIAMAEAMMLEGYGFTVLTAHSGEDAITCVDQNPHLDLILMDIDLGKGMDGTDAAAIILKKRQIPVLFLSSHTEREVVEKTEQITNYGYVVKHTGETVLIASIKMAFKLHQSTILNQKKTEELEAANEELNATIEDLEDATQESLRAQTELIESEANLVEAQTLARLGSWQLNPFTGTAKWSAQMFHLTGYPPEKGAPDKDTFLSFVHPDDREEVQQTFTRIISTGNPDSVEFRGNFERTGRKFFILNGEASRDESDVIYRINGTMQDITEQKEIELERETTVEFLKLINEKNSLSDLIKESIVFFKRQSGCEAIGIRLKAGDDYPYYETTGFSENFVSTENTLCDTSADGKILRTESGDPRIACMCGNIICGRVNPSKSFFTSYGSFWSNSTTELLATTTDADRQARTRNRCNGEGYESVALIPLRDGDGHIGLIQLNDKRKGVFTLNFIKLWERLSGYLSVALAKLIAKESLSEREVEYRSLFEHMRNGIAYCKMHFVEGKPVDFTYLAINNSFESQTGLTDVVGKRVSEVIPNIRESDPVLIETYGRVSQTGKPEQFEIHLDSLDMWFSISVYCPKPDHFVAVFDVISERKKIENDLRKSEEQYRLLVESADDSIVMSDLNGKHLFRNKAYYTSLGYEPGYKMGKNGYAIVHPDDLPIMKAATNDLFRYGSASSEYRVKHQNGNWIYRQTKTVLLYDAEKRPERFLSISRDVTEHKLMEQELIQSEEKYRLLAENMCDVIWILDIE
ncbi:MAG TPA: PAS domain S-box protein, partial [Spirochaetota bacterium]